MGFAGLLDGGEESDEWVGEGKLEGGLSTCLLLAVQ
jgi:hypothetical protein